MQSCFETRIAGGGSALVCGLAVKGEGRGLEAYEQSKVSSPVEMGAQSEEMMDTNWVSTWKEVGGENTVKARLVAKGYQAPDPRYGHVDIAGCVSRRSSRLQLISLGALTKATDLEPGNQARLPPGSWLRPRDLSPRSVRMIAGFGDCGRRRMDLMTPQLRSISPWAII